MRTKAISAVTLVLPFLMLGCDRLGSPSTSAPSQDRQAMAPSAQDKMLDAAPPAAGTPPYANEPAMSSTSPPSTPATGSPADAQKETKQGN